VTALSLLFITPVHADDCDIVISEVMVEAATGVDGQWVELCNIGSAGVDITSWVVASRGVGTTIITDRCPGGDCTIPAGDCWLFTSHTTTLQTEFDSGGYGFTVDPNKTYTVYTPWYYNFYAAGQDIARVYNASSVMVDCYSWNYTLSNCAAASYVPGGNGVDGTQYGAPGSPPQPVVNVGGAPSQWDLGINGGTPYQMNNQQAGGATAVTLRGLAAGSPWALGVAAFVGVGVLAGTTGLAIARRRRQDA
jgi:hypothetical protein